MNTCLFFVLLAALMLTSTLARAEYITVDTNAGTIQELNILSLAELIAYERDQEEHNAPDIVWPMPAYNTDSAPCSNIVSAQRIASTDLYQIQQWYYNTYHNIVAVSVDILDLRAAVSRAYGLGAWLNNPSCGELRERLYAGLIAPLIATTAFKNNMQVQDDNTGIRVSMLCGDFVCSPNDLVHHLQIVVPKDSGFNVNVV